MAERIHLQEVRNLILWDTAQHKIIQYITATIKLFHFLASEHFMLKYTEIFLHAKFGMN